MTLDPRGDGPGRRSAGGRRYLLVAGVLTLLLPVLASGYFFGVREPQAFGAAVVQALLVLGVALVGLLHLLMAGAYVGARHRDPLGWSVAALAGALLALGALGLGLLALG